MEKNETLFDLVAQFHSIERSLMENGGEITPEVETALTTIETALPMKIDAYQFVMERLEVGEAYWREKAASFTKIARSHASAKERMKTAITAAMQKLNVTELKGVDTKFTLAANQAKLVINEDVLDKSFTMTVTKTTQEPDKERIKTALKEGFDVAGAMLIPTLKSAANKKEK